MTLLSHSNRREFSLPRCLLNRDLVTMFIGFESRTYFPARRAGSPVYFQHRCSASFFLCFLLLMCLHFSFLCFIIVFVVSRVPRFLFLFCPTRMGHGWTIVGCDFFLPPLGAPPVIFKPEDSTELDSTRLRKSRRAR